MLPHAAALLWVASLGGAWAQLAMGPPAPTGAGIATTLPGTPPSPAAAAASAGTAAAASSTTVISPTNFLRTNLTLVDPLAVCNDGSPAWFYFRQGTGGGINKWVIRMEGGGFCSDQQSCVARTQTTPQLMGSSTQNYPDVLPGQNMAGVLDADVRSNPLMFTWNHVSIGYCSSDSYLGNAGPGNSPENGVFQFRGQRIVNATILALLATKNLAAATDILIAGVSAGGAGVLNLADGIYSTIQPRAPALVNFKGFVDGGWFLDVPSYSMAPSAFTFRRTAANFGSNFAAAYHPACVAAYPNQTWACFFAQYAWPFVRTPLIFHEYGYDGSNTGYNAAGSQANLQDVRSRLTAAFLTPANAVTGPGPANVTQAPSVRTQSLGQPPPKPLQLQANGSAAPTGLYAPGNLNVPPGLPVTGSPAVPAGPPTPAAGNTSVPSGAQGSGQLPAVFSPACGNHNIADNDLFSVSHIGTTRFTDVLTAWFTTGKAGLPLIDQTPGFAPPMACLQAI